PTRPRPITETDRAELMATSGVGVRGDAAQRIEPRLGRGPPDLAHERDPVQPGDLALTLDPGRVVGRQLLDKGADAIAQLEREVGGGSAHQLAHVLNRHVVVGLEAIWMLGLAHFWGTTSRRLSISA